MSDALPTIIQGRARLLALVVVASIVFGLSLRFHYPGYFDPLAVFHIDHFMYVGLQHEGQGSFLRYLLYYPRPFGNILLHHAGRLGIKWQLAPVFACYLLNVALVARYLERLTKRLAPLLCFILYAALICANPEYYLGLKMDPLAVYSLFFFLCSVHAWQSYLESERPAYLALAAALTLLGAMSKESYFVAVALFWMAQVWMETRHRKAAVTMLLISGVFMGFASYRALTWTRQSGVDYQPAGSAIAVPGGSVIAVLEAMLSLRRLLFFPAVILALVALTAAGWWRNRSVMWITVSCAVLGLASLVPNAMLPNHLFNHYSALGLLVACAPVLLVGHLWSSRPQTKTYIATAILGLSIYGLLLREQRWNIENPAGWFRDQEILTQRLLGTLDQIRGQTRPGNSILVAGITWPFNPFLAPAYIEGVMCGDCRWTAIVGASAPARNDPMVQTVQASDERVLGAHDRVFVVAPDGSLAGSYSGVPVAPQKGVRDSSSGVEFFATVNPVGAIAGKPAKTVVHWVMPGNQNVEIHSETPGGRILAKGPPMGNLELDEFADGTVLFLQNASHGDPTAPENTTAILILAAPK